MYILKFLPQNIHFTIIYVYDFSRLPMGWVWWLVELLENMRKRNQVVKSSQDSKSTSWWTGMWGTKRKEWAMQCEQMSWYLKSSNIWYNIILLYPEFYWCPIINYLFIWITDEIDVETSTNCTTFVSATKVSSPIFFSTAVSSGMCPW